MHTSEVLRDVRKVGEMGMSVADIVMFVLLLLVVLAIYCYKEDW